MSFESAMQRLEAIVDRLEEGETNLETSLQAYEEGIALARFCMERLNAAELRIQELTLE